MYKKKQQEQIISTKDFPREYLGAPQIDGYFPELERLSQRKRSLKNFKNTKFSAATEKFFRLYFYQGLDTVDRLIVHTEYLEMKSKKFRAIGLAFATAVGTYMALSRVPRFAPFFSVRLFGTIGVTYFVYSNYRVHSLYRLEEVVEPLYEKYLIK